MRKEIDHLDCFITEHVFNRIKIVIDDLECDETYILDMPPHVYEAFKKLIKDFEKGRKS